MPRSSLKLLLPFAMLCSMCVPPSSSAASMDSVEWTAIPGGTFQMGKGGKQADEKPAHTVSIKPFAIAKTLVTFGQYRACVAAGKCSPDHASDGTCRIRAGRGSWIQGNLPAAFLEDRKPAVCLDWSQAAAFSAWVGGRLPTEAEWEYAARSAGSDQRFPWGNRSATCRRAVMEDGAPGCGLGSTWAVCSKPEGNTRQGLCDMAGNAWEWTQDSYHENYAGAPKDGRAWMGVDEAHVIRGGSWYGGARPLWSTYRGSTDARGLIDDLGFRPVRPAAPD